MKTKILIVAALAACLTTAQARIGESEAQITMRYGKPVGTSPTPTGTGKLYHFWGYIVIVMIEKGIARSEAYQRIDLGPLGEPELAGFMEANPGGMKWRVIGAWGSTRSARLAADDWRNTITSPTGF